MASDRLDSCLRRNDGRLGMAQVVEMVGRADFRVDGDRSPPPAPTELILNTVALSLISPRRSGAEGGRREHLGENSHLRVRSRPPSVIPAQAGIHATSQHPLAPRRSRRSTDVSNARAGRSSAVGRSKPLRWLQIAWIPACAGMTEGWEWRKSLRWSGVPTSESMVTVRPPPAPTGLILNTVALSPISPRRAGGEKDPTR